MSEETIKEVKEPKEQKGTDAGYVARPSDAKFEGGEERRRPGMRPKRKVCAFCAQKITVIDYKDVARLRKYLTEKGKIIARRQTGLCGRHQRALTNAVKRARNMSLL
jgi:small subunit ribosomal protein S18